MDEDNKDLAVKIVLGIIAGLAAIALFSVYDCMNSPVVELARTVGVDGGLEYCIKQVV